MSNQGPMGVLRRLVNPADDVPVLLQVLEVLRAPIEAWREATDRQPLVTPEQQLRIDAWVRGEALPEERGYT